MSPPIAPFNPAHAAKVIDAYLAVIGLDPKSAPDEVRGAMLAVLKSLHETIAAARAAGRI